MRVKHFESDVCKYVLRFTITRFYHINGDEIGLITRKTLHVVAATTSSAKHLRADTMLYFLKELTCVLCIVRSIYSVKIGILCEISPYSWQYFFRAAGAISIAQDRLIAEGKIANDTIKR